MRKPKKTHLAELSKSAKANNPERLIKEAVMHSQDDVTIKVDVKAKEDKGDLKANTQTADKNCAIGLCHRCFSFRETLVKGIKRFFGKR
jgi:hypothetical protein